MTLPLSLPSQDVDDAATPASRKSEARRSSLAANQIKLTRIVEESEHEASMDSSKGISARNGSSVENVNDSDEDDDDGDDDDGDEDDVEDDDDFDSECSAMSDLEPKTDQLVERFRQDTRSLIKESERQYFSLVGLDVSTHPAVETSKPNPNPSDLRKLEIKTELEKLSSMQEVRETTFAETEQVLLQVQQQLNEIKKSILVSFALVFN